MKQAAPEMLVVEAYAGVPPTNFQKRTSHTSRRPMGRYRSTVSSDPASPSRREHASVTCVASKGLLGAIHSILARSWIVEQRPSRRMIAMDWQKSKSKSTPKQKLVFLFLVSFTQRRTRWRPVKGDCEIISTKERHVHIRLDHTVSCVA